MPVPKPRGMDSRMKEVIVRRTGLGSEEVVHHLKLDTSLEPTATINRILDSADLGRRNLDRRDDDNDDDDRNPSMPSPRPSQNLDSAFVNDQPFETMRGPPNHFGNKGGISKTTHHLLIAAGSIGMTIIIVMIILALYVMRKRGITLREAFKLGKSKVTRRGAPRTPPKNNVWDKKAPYNADYGSMRNNTVTPPQRAMSRSGSTSSQRPLMALNRSESFNNRGAERSASPDITPPVTFLLDSPPARNISDAASSPVLPIQDTRQSQSTRNTRSMSGASELQYTEPPFARALPPLPPPPTFKQFLTNRPRASSSGRGGANNIVSRFSWTNSNAPQTPHDSTRDINTQILVGRESFMTQRSSAPRFRTINSWVDYQADRIEAQKLREQYRMTQSTTASEDERYAVPSVPEVPQLVSEAEASPSTSTEPSTLAKPVTPPPPPMASLPGKNVKHDRSDTRTTVETAPIFRAHPGTEVRFSTRSAVPSEILNMGRKPSVLS